MTKKRCTSILAVVAILILLAVVTVVWVQFNQGAFTDKLNYGVLNYTDGSTPEGGSKWNRREQEKMGWSGTGGGRKEFIDKTYIGDLGSQEAVFVKPLKISPDEQNLIYDTLHKSHDKPTVRHHSGHFRHKGAEVWDPHPKYEIEAFGKKLLLELEHNNKFVAPDLHIVTHGENVVQKVRHDPKISGCYYTGKISGDLNSDVAVSLCHGMTGYIRSSQANYYIEPAENCTANSDEAIGTILHRIKEFPHVVPEVNNSNINEVFDPSGIEVKFPPSSGENHSIIVDDFPTEIVQRKPHKMQKRSAPFFHDFDQIQKDDDMVYNTNNYGVPAAMTQLDSEEAYRSIRDLDWTSTFASSGFARRSKEHFVKVLVVADNSMLEYHRTREILTEYILILMSYVALLFKDASIGNAINIFVYEIRILQEMSFTNTLSHDMLNKFCHWQKTYVKEKNHDVALLLTRHSICKDPQSCFTLGVAQVSSIGCHSAGCAIVRDKGLSTSYTIAHEVGHVLSMPHDEATECETHNSGFPNTNNIMSMTQAKNDSKPFTWSPCSRHYVTEFLDSSRAQCLLLKPSNNEYLSKYTNSLPGDTFEVDQQCELEFGLGYKMCPWNREPPCGHLWCINPAGECKSQLSPWAEGTHCETNGWCYKRQCIAGDRGQVIRPIDGGWGPWQTWGPCSRTCGGGIKISVRYCDSPRPENGGKYCIGESAQYASCNTRDCDVNAEEFRYQQCAQFNGITKNITNLSSDVKWIPKYGLGSFKNPEDYCRLYCKPQHSYAYYLLKNKVTDGTKCGPSGFDICVNGICRPGGCDNQLESKMILDECGVCGGDNSSCQEVTGTYNRSAEKVGYNRVVRIPKGSSNLNIKQKSYGKDVNYLALRDGETSAYILNGNHKLNTQETDVNFGPLIIKYSGVSAEPEWITTPKNQKLSKDLIVEVLSTGNEQGALVSPDISYRYVISNEAAPRFERLRGFISNSVYDYDYRGYSKRYGWRLYQQEWSKCSSICEGVQSRKPTCMDLITNVEVHSGYCDSSDAESATERRQCNSHCALSWNVLSKSICTPACGSGYRKIQYKCVKSSKKQYSTGEVNEKHCSILQKPPNTEACYTPCNTTRWDYTEWSQCTKSCGGGVQRRQAVCVDQYNNPIDHNHCRDEDKIIEQTCNNEKCPGWVVGETSECSAPCGGGYKNITYFCVLGQRIYEPKSCDSGLKPASTERCNEQPCGRWATDDSPTLCSVSCGEGVERRRYVCKKFDSDEVLDREYCRGLRMPREESRVCYKAKCESLNTRKYNQIATNEVNDNSFDVYDRRSRSYQWVPGEWSACSQKCDGGSSVQKFHCKNDLGEENHLMCDPNLQPRNVIRCNDQPCPKWKLGPWSPTCDSQCERHRQVRCMDNTMITYEDSHCEVSKKPTSSAKCRLAECPHANVPRTYFDSRENNDNRYKWKIGAWKQCSNTCGKGSRRRHVECQDLLNDITVVDSLCQHLRRPKAVKPCERYNCKYTWMDSYWSACSASCGQGVKTRNVTCHKVHHGGIIDPVPLPEIYSRIMHDRYCPTSNKPAARSKCLVMQCGDEYYWEPDDWKQCSHACGKKGRQTRVLNCISTRTKQKVPRTYCPKALKPPRKRKCNQWRCLPKSCKEIKHTQRTKVNKEYMISIKGRPVNIYCYKMDTPDPQEYISLHPDQMNFAEIYDRRLLDVESCPYDGNRRDNCQCDQIGEDRSGMTTFWKVRLNITSMRIIGDDFTFSHQIKGRQIPYGEAGDCYSSIVGCAQGRFSIDLTHTSFQLSPKVKWEKIGRYVSSDVRRTATSAQGKCGGYCGNCVPDSTYGLAVEIT